MNTKDYRHVCFKDLEDYFKRSDLFGSFTDEEKEKIRQNLDLSITQGISIVEGTYEDIKKLKDSNKLELNSIYIINNFRTIYKIDNQVLGDEDSDFISELFIILVRPISSNQFDKRASILNVNNLDIEYEFNGTKYTTTRNGQSVSIQSRGIITYMKDENNNKAFYDFRNKVQIIQDGVFYLTFPFNAVCVNNQIDECCSQIVFKEASSNNYLFNCVNVIFDKPCNRTLLTFCKNVTFKQSVNDAKGSINGVSVNSPITSGTFIETKNNKYYIYMDDDTKTMQTEQL